MWEELFNFMNFLDKKIKKYPNDNYFTIEMEQDLYNFANKIGFVSDEGWIKFKGKSFGLG